VATRSGAAWVPAWTVGVLIAAAALSADGVPLQWWLPLGLLVVAVPVTVIAAFAAERLVAVPHRLVAVFAAASWASWVALSGWTVMRVLCLLGGAVIVGALEWMLSLRHPIGQYIADTGEVVDRRPAPIRDWEGQLQRLAKKPIVVRSVEPWERPADGEQVLVDLPEDMTVKDLAGICDKIAAARHLPQGCVVRALDGAHQGSAVLDVMKRDCLAGDGRVIDEPTTPTTITEPFDVATTPRGEQLEVCLRQKSVIVGGTVGAGKTTFLHRLIMRLARMVDALIWVIDLNGGGVAAPWIGAYARGQAKKPTIDWVADDEAEAAVLIAVAKAVAKDRKTNKEAIRRKRAANTTILPVDKYLPAIVVLTDEGGEVRQAAGLLARLVDDGISRVAQIGRAEGVRIVMSVLRGTADLLNKGLRTVVGIRVCLRMEEEGEYDHVLGVNPGRARLLHIGSAYVYRTDTDYQPVLSRTVDVDLAGIERHSIATADLRPDLDERGRQVAAKVTLREVLDGRDPMEHVDITRHPAMRDVKDSRAYEGRWERKRAMLAELRGEELPDEVEDAPAVRSILDGPTVAPPGSAAERLLLGTGVVIEQKQQDPAPVAPPVEVQSVAPVEPDVFAEAARLLSPEHLALNGERPTMPAVERASEPGRGQSTTAREVILLVLRDAHPDMLTSAQVHVRVVERGYEVSPQRVHQVLTAMVGKERIRQDGSRYGLLDGGDR
jgi:hypothetical protein